MRVLFRSPHSRLRQRTGSTLRTRRSALRAWQTESLVLGMRSPALCLRDRCSARAEVDPTPDLAHLRLKLTSTPHPFWATRHRGSAYWHGRGFIDVSAPRLFELRFADHADAKR